MTTFNIIHRFLYLYDLINVSIVSHYPLLKWQYNIPYSFFKFKYVDTFTIPCIKSKIGSYIIYWFFNLNYQEDNGLCRTYKCKILLIVPNTILALQTMIIFRFIVIPYNQGWNWNCHMSQRNHATKKFNSKTW